MLLASLSRRLGIGIAASTGPVMAHEALKPLQTLEAARFVPTLTLVDLWREN